MNGMGEEECIVTVRCKSKDLPQIKQALIQAQECAAGENVRTNRGEGERELKEREEAMRAELTKIAEFVKDPEDYYRKPDLTLTMSGKGWGKLYLNQETPEDLIKSGELKTTASATDTARLLGLFDQYSPEKAVVISPDLWHDH